MKCEIKNNSLKKYENNMLISMFYLKFLVDKQEASMNNL